MTRLLVLSLASTVLMLTGCSSDAGGAAAPAPAPMEGVAQAAAATTAVRAPAKAKASRRGRTIKTVNSQFGRILADGRGQAVYVFDEETTSKPECYGGCAKAWPPVLTAARPMGGKGVRARILGITRRRDGSRQVTLDGQPLYYYVRDSPGRVLCHNVTEFGGLWLVLRADGTPVP